MEVFIDPESYANKNNAQFLSFGSDLNSKVEEILGSFTQQASCISCLC